MYSKWLLKVEETWLLTVEYVVANVQYMIVKVRRYMVANSMWLLMVKYMVVTCSVVANGRVCGC